MPVQQQRPEPYDLSLRKIREIQRILLRWGRNNYADFPWRNTSNRFHALIAEIMLQRTKAEQVTPIYTTFVKRYPDHRTALEDDPETIRKLISRLGLSWRAGKVLELIKILSDKDGMIPTTKEELTNLPGVGEYIANAFLSMHCGIKAPIVDANAVRVWRRIIGFEINGEIRRKKWFSEMCMQLTPDDDHKAFNYALLDFSRAICKTKPICEECPLQSECSYRR